MNMDVFLSNPAREILEMAPIGRLNEPELVRAYYKMITNEDVYINAYRQSGLTTIIDKAIVYQLVNNECKSIVKITKDSNNYIVKLLSTLFSVGIVDKWNFSITKNHIINLSTGTKLLTTSNTNSNSLKGMSISNLYIDSIYNFNSDFLMSYSPMLCSCNTSIVYGCSGTSPDSDVKAMAYNNTKNKQGIGNIIIIPYNQSIHYNENKAKLLRQIINYDSDYDIKL